MVRHYRENPRELMRLGAAEQRAAMRAMKRDRDRWKQSASPEQVAWAEQNVVFDLYDTIGR